MADPRWLNSDEDCTWRTFLEATHRLSDQLDHELQRDAGFPAAYYQIMSMLSEAPDRTLRMSELADRTWSSRSRLSHAVDRLEEKGWVARVGCPQDRRVAYAVLTDAGFACLESAAPGHVEGVRRHLFDQLTSDQVKDLGRISQAIASHLACAAAHRSSTPA